MIAAQAFQADIRAKADHFPFERAAGVRLAQANNVIQLKVGQHEGIITRRNLRLLWMV
jgi:hypothetical protein